MGGLDEHGQAEALQDVPHRCSATAAARWCADEPHEVDLGHPGGAHQLFEEDLVEAHGRGGHAGADVGRRRASRASPGRCRPRRRGRGARGRRRPPRAGRGRAWGSAARRRSATRPRGRSRPTGPRGRRPAARPGPPVRRTARPRARRSARRRAPPRAGAAHGWCPLVAVTAPGPRLGVAGVVVVGVVVVGVVEPPPETPDEDPHRGPLGQRGCRRWGSGAGPCRRRRLRR